jgi:hypothetical protein
MGPLFDRVPGCQEVNAPGLPAPAGTRSSLVLRSVSVMVTITVSSTFGTLGTLSALVRPVGFLLPLEFTMYGVGA